MSRIKIEYEGHKITYYDHSGTWSCDELGIKAEQLNGVREKINQMKAAERKFERVPVYVMHYDGAHSGFCTSVTDDGYYWVVYSEAIRHGGKREKVSKNNIYLADKHNDEILATITQFEEQRKNLDKQVDALKLKLVKATPDYFQNHKAGAK